MNVNVRVCQGVYSIPIAVMTAPAQIPDVMLWSVRQSRILFYDNRNGCPSLDDSATYYNRCIVKGHQCSSKQKCIVISTLY